MSHGANIKLNDAGEEYMAQRRRELRPIDGGERHPVLRRFAASVGNIQVRHLSPTHVDQWFFGDKGLVRTVTELLGVA